jgi:hypothetical protein
MSPRPPKYAFSHDDLSVYERIDPHEFPDFDEADSVVVEQVITKPPDDADAD